MLIYFQSIYNMFNRLINTLKKYDYIFIKSYFRAEITKVIKNTFTKLNNSDIEILVLCTSYMIEDIMSRYNVADTNQFINQFTHNKGRDIISLCLILLPFIKNEYYDKISNLSELLYNTNTRTIPATLLNYEIKDTLKKYFPYSNFSLGLLNHNDNSLLELYKDDIHLIYHIIHHNFVSILQTIKMTNGKLYVNWLNTIPLVSYENSEFYKSSLIEITDIIDNINKFVTDNRTDEDNLNLMLLDKIHSNKRLWFGDYYNTMTNGYYYSIKSIKWLIFCRRVVSNKYYYSIQYLNKIFDINKMFQYMDYDNMFETDKILFRNKLNEMRTSIVNKNKYYLNHEYEKDLLKNLFIFMVSNYSKKTLLRGDIYNKFRLNEDTDRIDLEEDEIILRKDKKNYIGDTDLINLLEVLEPKHLWNYIKESLILLKTTIYGKYLIKDNMINMDFFNLPDSNINLKNIYNIAKILCHYTDSEGEYMRLGISYNSLSQEQVLDFFKMYSINSISWLNIRQNINLQEGENVNNIKYIDILEQIIIGWNKYRVKLVWDYLSYNGTLTEFKVYINTYDVINQKAQLKIYFKENSNIFKENYFMTNEPYTNLKIYDIK